MTCVPHPFHLRKLLFPPKLAQILHLEAHHIAFASQQVKNSAGEDAREGVRVTSLNVEELKDSRGTANFALKWVKDAKKAAYLNVVPVKGLTRPLSGEDDNQWVPIIGFDCRGLDVTGFHPEVSANANAFIINSR